ncbi:MAG: exosortase/archaeosortase family protein [Bacteroidales bacterium]
MQKTTVKSLFKSLFRRSYFLKNLLLFFLLFFGSHFIWKLVIHGNLHGHDIYLFSLNLTPLFYSISKFTAAVCWKVLTWFDLRPLILNDTIIHYLHPGGNAINIIWGCTGVKQMLMFLIVMIFTPGSALKKAAYIPAGLFLLWCYNIIRICVIAYYTGIDAANFDYWHTFFNAPYYALIFLLWVVWEEFFNRTPQNAKIPVIVKTA